MACIYCARHLHEECDSDPCCCITDEEEATEEEVSLVTSNPLKNATVVRGRPELTPEEMQDPHSTGRKRAAKLYPLDEKASCEWSMKKNCGGGEHPIVGCINGLQVNRHHGPDKFVLNNNEGNVHRICAECHNRWHYLNDGGYNDYTKLKLHSPVAASLKDVMDNETDWIKGKFKDITNLRVERFHQKGDSSD